MAHSELIQVAAILLLLGTFIIFICIFHQAWLRVRIWNSICSEIQLILITFCLMIVGVTINCQAPSSSGSPGPVGPPGSTRYCGREKYNPLTHLCCNRQVIVKPSSSFTGCCERVAYSPSVQICCSGVLQSKKTGLTCCGTRLYDYRKQICCNRIVMAKRWPSARCCGSISYDSSKYSCCGNVLNPKKLGHYCCGTTPYDPKVQLCCGGRVHSKTSSFQACCGRTIYDTNRQICCYGKLISIFAPYGTRLRCCG